MLPPANCLPYLAASRSACSIRTSFQSASSSSAITMGSIVLTPWPISGFFDAIVMMPSGAIRMKALSVAPAGSERPPAAARARPGSNAYNSRPPPAAALALRIVRRETVLREPSAETRAGID